MNTRDRYFHIDILRATGILLMILTHVLSWHFGIPHILDLWNSIHFVVVGLVFCSAYIYGKSNQNSDTRHHIPWFFKRVMRLYAPFVLYLCMHYLLWFLFPTWIRGYGIQKSYSFVIASLTLTGGVDIGWLTTVFIQLAILFPFLLSLTRHKNKALFIGLLIFCSITAFFRIPTEYTRAIAWLPWSLIAVFGFLYSDYPRSNMILISLITYAIFSIILRILHMPLLMTDHKYPPDLYYLSYGVFVTSCILGVLPYIEKFLLKARLFITFVSRESYTLFFVHMIVLDATMTRIPSDWIQETVIITSVSLTITYAIKRLNGLFHLKKV